MQKQEVLWKKENKQLDDDAENNVQLKKQINKQSDMDSLIQNSINDKIYELKQQATQLTKKLQNQRHKNMQLETIIKTIKYRMQDDKKSQVCSVTESNFQNIQSYQRKIKKLQYDLDQINSRSNKIGSIVNEKKHKISILRTQRVIDSGIFRNIEKELIDYEMEFKKLLIEKIKHQKVYTQSLTEYNSLKGKAQQYFQNNQTVVKSPSAIPESNEKEIEQNSEKNKSNPKNKFKELERQPSQYRNTTIQSDLRKEEQNLFYQFKAKKFLMNLNLLNVKEFTYNLHNIQKTNGQYFATLNSTGDQITKLQTQIKKIQINIRQNGIKFYKPKQNLSKTQQTFLNCQKIKKQVIRTQQKVLDQAKQVRELMNAQNFSNLVNLFDCRTIPQQRMDPENLIDFLKQIEININDLKYYVSPKLTEQSIDLKTGRSQRQKKQQKIEDIMNRVKIYEQSDKIMGRQDFKEEYKRMIECTSVSGSQPNLRKKTRKILI